MTFPDPHYLPMMVALRDFRRRIAGHARTVTFCAEGAGCLCYQAELSALEEDFAENLRMAERLAKSLLWIGGGHTLSLSDARLARSLGEIYGAAGPRAFDAEFMAGVFGSFEVKYCPASEMPPSRAGSAGRGPLQGRRKLGLDVGASNVKVCAVLDGVPVFRETMPWSPRAASDPAYHERFLLRCLERARDALGGADGIGVSTAGIVVRDELRTASLFTGVADPALRTAIPRIYLRLGEAMGVPIRVVNDGDAAALAGFEGENVLGVSMGSSLAGGFIGGGRVNGCFNELAFVPVDFSQKGARDEWSGDVGCGVNYLSQEGAVRLANLSGLSLPEGLTTPEKCGLLREAAEAGEPGALGVFDALGVCLGWSAAYYREFYEFRDLLLLGGVTVGRGGERIREAAGRVLEAEFPALGIRLKTLKERGLAQCLAAASL